MLEIIVEANTFLIDHTHRHILELKDRNNQYSSLLDDIKCCRDSLKSELNIETWLRIKSLIRLMMKQSGIETTYLYCQGMKDITFLSNYADSDFADIFLEK